MVRVSHDGNKRLPEKGARHCINRSEKNLKTSQVQNRVGKVKADAGAML